MLHNRSKMLMSLRNTHKQTEDDDASSNLDVIRKARNIETDRAALGGGTVYPGLGRQRS